MACEGDFHSRVEGSSHPRVEGGSRVKDTLHPLTFVQQLKANIRGKH